LYKMIDMLALNPDGSSFRSKFVVSTLSLPRVYLMRIRDTHTFLLQSPWALADATIQNRVNLSTTSRPCWVRDVIAKMYQDEVLNVEYLGLQCVGFDHQVYNGLRSFFEVSERMQAAKRGSVGRPETSQGGKRQRIH